MKTFYLVEADTDYESLFCYELKFHSYPPQEGRMFYTESNKALFAKLDRPKFFGILNSLCRTKNNFDDVQPIKLLEHAPTQETVGEMVDRVQGPSAWDDGSPLPTEPEEGMPA